MPAPPQTFTHAVTPTMAPTSTTTFSTFPTTISTFPTTITTIPTVTTTAMTTITAGTTPSSSTTHPPSSTSPLPTWRGRACGAARSPLRCTCPPARPRAPSRGSSRTSPTTLAWRLCSGPRTPANPCRPDCTT
ncbi:hypothetical protein FOCC_FOCC002262 [Frankliniella occidentalis]|nr:hypothetical protein FOCC_FOCC002262 [Frankliniella occidentalis]